MVSGCQWRLPRARLRLLPSRIRPGLGALAENSHCRGRAPAPRPGGRAPLTVASPRPAPGPGRPAPSQPGSVGHAGGPSQLSPTRSLSPSHRLWPPGLAQWPGPGIAPAAGESTWQVQCWRAARRRRHCPGRRDRASGLTAAVSGNPGGVGDCGPQCTGPARAGHGDSAAASGWPVTDVTGWLSLAGLPPQLGNRQ